VAKRLDNLRHDLHIYWLSWRIQFIAATKLRTAFVLQIVGMIVNNLGLLAAWLFLFQAFGTINGWSGLDYMGMQGVTMLVFGTLMMFVYGITELPRHVDQGSFDAFLTKPASVLAQLAGGMIEVGTIGDVILGVVLIGIYMVVAQVSLLAVLMFIIALAVAMTLLFCFTLLPYLLAFYMFDSDKVGRNIAMLFVDMGLYPTGVISGGLRVFLLTAFPGLFAFVIPLNVLRGLEWEYILLGAVVAAFWVTVTMWAFKKSLRRYESANLIGAR
jgi:ABC-2 type transport system permease protein